MKKPGFMPMADNRSHKVAIISCSGVIDIVNEALKGTAIEYKLFTFKAPCLFNVEEKYFEHYFDLASKYSNRIFIIMGNCSPYLDKYIKLYQAVKISGDNCFEFVIPNDQYNCLKDDKSLFVLPAQATNAKIYLKQMGLNNKDGQDMYRSLINEIVFLNPKDKPLKGKSMKMIETTFGIPSKAIDINLNNFKDTIHSYLRSV